MLNFLFATTEFKGISRTKKRLAVASPKKRLLRVVNDHFFKKHPKFFQESFVNGMHLVDVVARQVFKYNEQRKGIGSIDNCSFNGGRRAYVNGFDAFNFF